MCTYCARAEQKCQLRRPEPKSISGEESMKTKLAALFTALSLLVTVLAACASAPQEAGILEGHVTIGPLMPVVQQGVPEPTPAPEVYAARQIVILSGDGKRELERVQIGADGNYRVELAAGTYQVDINHAGIDSSKDLPRRVEILADETTRLDVEIDTGIR